MENAKIGNSKRVTTLQEGIHPELSKLVEKHKNTLYRRPLSEFTLKLANSLESKLFGKEIIIDAGCGVGLSSYELSKRYPKKIILGIDRSESRIERKNFFKKEALENLFFIRGKLDEWWPLLLKWQKENKVSVFGIYILYPNPYPKAKNLKLRWHAHPVFHTLMEFGSPIVLRSNFLLYLKEFEYACGFYQRKTELKRLQIDRPMTHFEKKYFESEHELYELKIN